MSADNSVKELPTRSKEESKPDSVATHAASTATPIEDKGPSKSALKKAAKDQAKAEKAAQRAAKEQEERANAAANDTSKHLYGLLTAQAKAPTPADPFFKRLGQIATAEINGKEITVQARVHNARVQSAKLAFLVLREQNETIQVVVAESETISRAMVKYCGAINTESYVRVTGVINAPKDPVHSTTMSHVELHLRSLYVISVAEEKLPLYVKDCSKPPASREMEEEESSKDQKDVKEESDPNASLKTRLDHKIISARAPASNAIFQLQSEICAIFTEYMLNQSFTLIQPSYLAGAATEGGSGVFEVKYFERKAYLTQSPQFFKQMAIASDLGPVFSIGPVFRAENSNTKRHLTEFTGLDFEMPIQQHYHEVLTFGENLMLHIIRELQTRPKPRHLTELIRQAGYTDAGNFLLPEEGKPALRLTFPEAKKILKESGYDFGEATDKEGDEGWEWCDFDTPQEKALGEVIRKKHQTDFYTIDQYPLSVRPFYTHPSASDPRLSNSYDFFMRGQEIMSGAQRVHDIELLRKIMRSKGVDPEDEGFKDYQQAFRYGCPMHGGGGLGLNRILMLFLGLNNVREATLFPRDPIRLAP